MCSGVYRATRIRHEDKNNRQADRLSAAGGHVSVPQADRVVVPRNRKTLQRPTPFDRHALRREDRAPCRGRPKFPQGRRVFSAALSLRLATLPFFSARSLSTCRPECSSRHPRRPPGDRSVSERACVSSPFFAAFLTFRDFSAALRILPSVIDFLLFSEVFDSHGIDCPKGGFLE